MTADRGGPHTAVIGAPASFWAFFPDALLAVCCYLVAYRLRFPGLRLAAFLPTALAADAPPGRIGGSVQDSAHPLWAGIAQDSRFYFVHSYYPDPADSTLIAATSCYPTRFTCAVARDNIFAVQFHPEKSQAAGLALLRNFSSWDGHGSDQCAS